MSEFRFRDQFRDFSSLDFDTDSDSETRLELRVSVFRFRDERTGNLCYGILKSVTKREVLCLKFYFNNLTRNNNIVNIELVK